ncbi:MAG: FKBP-type peptidyl-prolyl cis-trans isomerase [Muribaculaceae bacterium]|nr:FKBP-type peptidyl-prolyl cis-trans isomerase [Muribaculaceae bacterium]
MRRLMLIAMAAAVCVAAVAMPARVAAAPVPDVPDSVSVAVGTVLGSTIGRIVDEFEQGGVALDRATVAAMASKAIEGRYTGMSLERAQLLVNDILNTMKPMAGVDSFDTASQVRFLDEAAAKEGAVRTATGVVLEVITEGEGAMPGRDDTVSVFYVGRLSDGTVFDATDDAVDFRVSELTPGLAEALTMMRPGGKYRVTIPSEQAYGEDGIPGIIPGRAALQFIVELNGVRR